MRMLPPARLVLRVLTGTAFLIEGLSYAGSVITYPYRGVTRIVRTETSPRIENINVMQIDLTQPGLRFRMTNGNANQPANSTIRETTAATTLSYMTSQNGQIAINAHFFQPNSTDANRWVVGLAASQGNIYSSFEGPTPATANPVNSLTLTQNYAIMTHAPALNIDALNNAQVVHYDAGFPDKKHVLESVTLYNAVSGSAQIVTNGVTTIPTYTQNAATGLIDGSGYSSTNSWYNGIRARTAIGLTSDNHTLVLFTIDEAGGSVGMTVGEVADMLRTDYQVWNALNLDGGGSATMALQDPVTHVRSVINTPTSGQRVVATSLVVFADPEIAVEQPAGTNLTDGSASIDCGSVNLGSTSAAFTVTVKNIGADDLTGLAVTKTGTNAGEFTVSAPGATTVVPNSSTTFTVSFTPAAAGPRTAAIHIASNDTDENQFDIVLAGQGNRAPLFPGYALNGTAGQPLAIYPAKILARASDPEGDAVALTRVFSPSAHGGMVTLTGTVNYTPPNGFAGTDTFEVELTDARGASARGTITITLAEPATGTAAMGLNLTSFAIIDGKAEMVFRGIPERSYLIQRSSDLSNWSDLATVTAGPDGKIQYTDPAPAVPQGFYRTHSN